MEISPHVLKRMVDRRLTEVDLRRMLEHARGYHKDIVGGRWAIETSLRKSMWEIIVEPGMIIDYDRKGQALGIEITAPNQLSVIAINRVLRKLGLPTVTRTDLARLRAA